MNTATSQHLVLVTGGNGFLGLHCVRRLLLAGYSVRTTVRSPAKEAKVRAALADAEGIKGTALLDHLSFANADLNSPTGWPAAVGGCTYILHVASPLYAGGNEAEAVPPAVNGTLYVMRAAAAAGVRRVVLTSSFQAIGYTIPWQNHVFTEEDWTDVNSPAIGPYTKSKVAAEKAAWDFMKTPEAGDMELTVINPTYILGPFLGNDVPTGFELISALLKGGMPRAPMIYFAPVDVRDVAELHFMAMTKPEAAGQRFLCLPGDPLSALELSMILRAKLGEDARKAPTKPMANWVIHAFGFVNAKAKQAALLVGKRKVASPAKTARVFGWTPRPSEEAILSGARRWLEVEKSS